MVGHPVERHPLVVHPLVLNPVVVHPLVLRGVGLMRRWVLGIAGTHVALAAVLLWLTRPSGLGGSPATLVGCIAAFGLVGLMPMHLELRRHACTVVLSEAVLVVALVHLGPLGVVAAVVAGEAVACITSSQSGLKLTFNVAAAAGAASCAAAVFSRLSSPSASVLTAGGWPPLAVAVTAYVAVSIVTTSTILAVAEHRRMLDVLFASAGTVAASSAASASLGVSAVALAEINSAAPVLLVPLVALVFLGTRRMAVQSAEHLRFQRLYEASSRTAELVSFEDTLAQLAAEARGLVTGSAAVCWSRRPDGAWTAMVVDDAGARPAPAEVVDALVAISAGLEGGPGPAEGNARTLPAAEWPRALKSAVPGATDLVWCPPRRTAKARVGLAVFREIGPDEQADGRAEVLTAFAGHAALAAANALLLGEVEDALRHQIDLTQQKGEFLATVSHELRTPLTCVLGAVSTLRRCRGRLDDNDVDRLLGTALEQGDRLKRLIEDLLQVASAEHGEMTPEQVAVDVPGTVAGVLADLAAVSGGRLQARVSPDCGPLRTDPTKLRQILLNLVENGVKYAPAGSIEVLARPAPWSVEFCVTDHGPGIPAADRERVFERFVQLDQSSTRRQGGTGLGLYLCRQLAGLLGGTLTLEETPGGGCTFRLRLPTGPGGPVGAAEAARVDGPGDDSGKAPAEVRLAGSSTMAAPAGV
jgi:signal transduction histidine kinase